MLENLIKFFKLGLYTKRHIAQLVFRGTLTAEQYKEITGEDCLTDTM